MGFAEHFGHCQVICKTRTDENHAMDEFHAHIEVFITRKYPLRGYILGVLVHTTAWDRHWGGDETLK